MKQGSGHLKFGVVKEEVEDPDEILGIPKLRIELYNRDVLVWKRIDVRFYHPRQNYWYESIDSTGKYLLVGDKVNIISDQNYYDIYVARIIELLPRILENSEREVVQTRS